MQSLGGDLFELIPIPLEPRGSERWPAAGVRRGVVDILMQFARKVQEPGRSRNLSCLMLHRAKATEDRWRHCFQPPEPLTTRRPPLPQPMRDDRGGHLGWRVIERKR